MTLEEYYASRKKSNRNPNAKLTDEKTPVSISQHTVIITVFIFLCIVFIFLFRKLLNHLKRPVKEEKPEWHQLISDLLRWFNVVETEEDPEEITEAIVTSKKR